MPVDKTSESEHTLKLHNILLAMSEELRCYKCEVTFTREAAESKHPAG